MLIHIKNGSLHPMHIATVEDAQFGCVITTTNGQVFDLDTTREDFNSLWLDALSWWSTKPAPLKFTNELQAVIDKANKK